MKYKAVIFDLGGTLIANTLENTSWRTEMAAILSAPEADFGQVWEAAFKKRMTGEFYLAQDCIAHCCRELNLQATEAQIQRAAKLRLRTTRQQVLSLQSYAVEIISRLKSIGLKIGLLSNCSTETTTVWDETPFASIFDITVFSCAVGLMKPDPRIYHLALEKLQVEPRECLYVADGMDGELKAADAVGMTPVRISFPHANKNDPYLEDWHGPSISSLSEVLDLVG
ncbi:MAG: HAD-IA family hydrolase [Dehalococcoidales bacterium]|jgi:putative hydrolase of the HAD superfamily